MVEESLTFLVIQARCRLVQDDQSRVEGQGLDDLDDVLLEGAELPDRAAQVRVAEQEFGRYLARPRGHRPLVEEAAGEQTALNLAAQEDVLQPSEVSGERQLLVDRVDAQVLGITGPAQRHGLAVDEQRAPGPPPTPGADADQQ